MTIDELKTYDRILILGYGIEGRATERFLKKFHPKAEIGIADQNDGPDYLKKQKDYDLAVRTPLLRPYKVTIPYTTATNLFFGNVKNTIIGVTGTKGKSTTVSILHEVLKKGGIRSRLRGNIGDPMLDALTKGIHEDDVFVLELSSYQLEDLSYAPHIACFLNIYEEKHNHRDFDEYFEAKTNITRKQKADDVFMYNGKVESIHQLAQETHAQTQDFTMFDVSQMIKDMDLSYLTHEDNLKAVWAIASYFDVSEEAFKKGLQAYTPLPHRLKNIGMYNDITFYDDSSSVNPISTIFALDAIEGVNSIILGGEERDADWHPLAEKLAEKDVGHVIILPEQQEKIYNEIALIDGYEPEIVQAQSMDEAVKHIFSVSTIGSIGMLSPGAPSYNMYTNNSERADDFIRTIKKYATKTKKHTKSKKKTDPKSTKKTSKK